MCWVDVDGDGWRWVEVGTRFSNTHLGMYILSDFSKCKIHIYVENCRELGN